VADPDQVRAAVESAQATHLLHLAGLQVPICRADPIRGARVNVIGTLAVFETARILKGQIHRVVFASSAAVHGPQPPDHTGPVPDDALLRPVTHYGAFKVANELNARVYFLDHGITSIGLRPWTVYGVGRDFGVTSEPTRAIKAAAAGRPYHISYGGLQDLQYVRDVARIFLHALSTPFEGSDSFNIRGDVVPIEHFVETLESVAPSARGSISHGDRQLPIAPSLDDRRLHQALGPIPATPLEQGIRETYQRFQTLHREGRLDLSDLES
jgi:nucleoside-diphosphate-sugar epimerase